MTGTFIVDNLPVVGGKKLAEFDGWVEVLDFAGVIVRSGRAYAWCEVTVEDSPTRTATDFREFLHDGIMAPTAWVHRVWFVGDGAPTLVRSVENESITFRTAVGAR